MLTILSKSRFKIQPSQLGRIISNLLYNINTKDSHSKSIASREAHQAHQLVLSHALWNSDNYFCHLASSYIKII